MSTDVNADVNAPTKKKSSSRGGNKSHNKNKSTYKGKLLAIDGQQHVYDLIPGRADLYIRTSTEMIRCFGSEYGPDVARSFKQGRLVTYPMPIMPQIKVEGKWRDKKEDEMNFVEKKQINSKISQCLDNELKLNNNMGKAYADLEGQCSPAIMQTVQVHAKYKKADDNSDPLALLSILKEVSNKVGEEVFPLMAITLSLQRFLDVQQSETETMVHYEERFTNAYYSIVTVVTNAKLLC